MLGYKLQQFMRGRNGGDQLSFAAILLSLIISVISMFFRDIRWIFNLADLALIIYAFFRMCSRNIEKRRAENEKFMSLIYKIRSKKRYSQGGSCGNYSSYGYDYNSKQAKKVKYKEDKKNYKYMKCPQCNTRLRVPKGKGKLIVTCPKCHNKFKAKS